jgi:RarD protein
MNAKLKLFTSMFLFGTIGLFVRAISLPSSVIALVRAFIGTLFLLLLLVFKHQKPDFSAIRRNAVRLLVSGTAMAFNWILLFEAYKYTTVSVATLSYYFAPVIVTIVSPLIFKEKLTGKQILCFVMSTVGIVMITGIGGIGGGRGFIGILFGLGAAVFYATVILLNKFIKNVEGIHRTFLQFVAAVIVLLPYVLATSGFNLNILDGKGWGSLLIVGLVHTGITYCMYFSSLKELPGQKVAILSYIDPLVAVLVSVTILGEAMTVWQIVGGVLILGFTLWNEIGTGKEKGQS